jgi:perosamine synthetase
VTTTHHIPWWRTEFGQPEVQRLTDAIAHEHISQGPVTAEFEDCLADALGVRYCVATTSGSMALLMALMVLGIGRDDEVIVPNRTWIASAHAVAMLGAKVVLADVLPGVPTLDLAQARRKITGRTKAIMPVHLNGRAVDMDAVALLASEYGLGVVEDASQALFSRNAAGYLGTQSDAGCFSLSVAKLISTGQGGFIVTNNNSSYEKLKLIRTHGVSDVINASYTELGFNFRFTDLLASVGLAQLDRAHGRIAHLKEVYATYEAGLAELSFLNLIPVAVSQGEVPLYVEVLCHNRDKLVDFLASRGIQTRPFYPDLHLADHLQAVGEFPNSRVFSEGGLFLPCGPSQAVANIKYVLEALRIYDKNASAYEQRARNA